MRIIVKIREKKPIEEYTKHMREHLESRFEDITNVRSAEFDTRTGKIYIEYVDPAATEDDDRSDSIDT
jgi:hypothetical protein